MLRSPLSFEIFESLLTWLSGVHTGTSDIPGHNLTLLLSADTAHYRLAFPITVCFCDGFRPEGLARHLRFSANDVTEGSVPSGQAERSGAQCKFGVIGCREGVVSPLSALEIGAQIKRAS